MAKLGSDDLLVVVLGAGATRACSFVDPTKLSCLPPLDGDFFTQLQRVPDPKHRKDIEQVMADVVELFGSNFSVTLETVFATVEHTIRMLTTTGARRAFKKPALETKRDRLLAAIAIGMEASLAERGDDGHTKQMARNCKDHERLVEDVLRGGDQVISFNYDCVIDYALREKGDKKWNARYGYGFKLGARGALLSGDGEWQPKIKAAQKATVNVHKLHGSLHFQFGKNRVVLKQRPYTKQRGTPRYSIIPPESNKAYDRGLFAQLWKNAAAALGRARHLVVIGYSLPTTDLHATALFRTSLKPKKLKSLVVVNSDRAARARARGVMQRAMTSETCVLSFDSLKEFLATKVAVWRGS
jgi:hypothetical protein